MICSAKPGLTKDLCVVHKEEFSKHAICGIRTLDEKPSVFIRDKPIFSSEMILHKGYYRKGSVERKSLAVGLKGPGAKTNC
jgi:hypothetical protein